ncbi:hypothetical protein ACHAWF_009685 [Thalassiosira exigua]
MDMADPSPPRYEARLLVAPSKATVPDLLSDAIVRCCASALESRDAFSIALSGGSLPSFLRDLPEAFRRAGLDPRWERWRVLLADERCVTSSDPDSNLGSIRSNFADGVPIPRERVHGIDESLLGGPTAAVARAYERDALHPALEECGGMLDCVVLGFGPDGHTCSLFPGHALLRERSCLVAPIDDSPKPPPSRVTLTFPVLNEMSRTVIVCGAGPSKRPIVDAVFDVAARVEGDYIQKTVAGAEAYQVGMKDPSPYPVGMAQTARGESLVWVVDADAASGISGKD